MSTNSLGRYHIIREIARSNDVVYEAMDPAQGRKVALKELQVPANLIGQARHERIQRFTREARAAASLRHENIVAILDHGQVQGRYYIAMEFLEGQSLRDVLRQRGVLPLQEAVRIATKVAEGLEFAHRNGVVHRDVKPDNVHLEPSGRVVITDFGIARLTFEPSLTADGQIFGTPSYMSPEQVAGKGIDARSDLFSLGVMLYEMVAGRKPFTGDSVITITYNIMNMEPPPIPGAPPGLDQVIRRAMAKDAGSRYRSAAEMAEDLRLVSLGGMPRHASSGRPDFSAGRSSLPPPPPMPGPQPSYGAPGGYGGGAPPPLPPPPRPMPQPQFGGGSAGPVPGARPMPLPGAGSFTGYPAGAVPGAYPPSAPSQGAVPAAPPGVPVGASGVPPYLYRNRSRRGSGGTDLRWFFGWLGVALVIGVMILSVVWASVTAYDRFQKDAAVAANHDAQAAADKALAEGRLEDALASYLKVAGSATGDQRVSAERNAAVAAVRLAEKKLDAGQLDEAEKLSRQALQLDANLAAAFVALGRVQAQQGKVDESMRSFDGAAQAAARAEQAGASAEVLKAARESAGSAPLWKAKVLYEDGKAQLAQNAFLARQRFEAAVQAAPGSVFAQNAQAELNRMDPRQGLAGAPASGPPGGNGSGAPGAPPPPAGWDPNYGL